MELDRRLKSVVYIFIEGIVVYLIMVYLVI